MTIDPALFPPGAQPWSEGSKGKPTEALGDAFARILASLDPQLEAEEGQSAPAIPRIGSQPHAFAARPVLLDTPVGLIAAHGVDRARVDQPAPQQTLSNGAASPVVFASSGPGLGALVRQLGQFLRSGDAPDLARPAPLPPMPAEHQPAEPGRLAAPAAQGLQPVPASLVVRSAPMVPIPMPTTPKAAISPPEARLARAPTPASLPQPAKATPQPFSAMLLQGAEGLQLVIRLPEVTPELRAQLEDRLARLFARRGLALPETQITGPEAGNNERTA